MSGHPLKIFWKQAPMTTAGVGGSPLDALGAAAASVVAAAAALAASLRCFGEAAPLKGGLRRERRGKVK